MAKKLFELLGVKPDEVSRDIDIDSARPDDYENKEGLVWYNVWNEGGDCVAVYAQWGEEVRKIRAIIWATDGGSPNLYHPGHEMEGGLRIASNFIRTAKGP